MAKPDQFCNRAEAYEANDDVPLSPADQDSIGDIILKRYSRREMMRGTLGVAAAAALFGPAALASRNARAETAADRFNFAEVAAGVDETLASQFEMEFIDLDQYRDELESRLGRARGIVRGLINRADGDFVVAPNIRSAEDLKGKKVSVREPDGIDTRFARAVFRREGLDADQMVEWMAAGARSRRIQRASDRDACVASAATT